MARILVFGDSTTWGAWDPDGGWVQRLRRALERQDDPAQVYNLGVSGDMVEDVADRFVDEFDARDIDAGETIVIIQAGGNDAAYMNDEERVRTFERSFRKQLDELLDTVTTKAEKVLYLGVTPPDEERADPVSWDDGVSYRYNLAAEYNGHIREACEKEDVPFLNLAPVLGEEHAPLLADGVHPNADGHEKIFHAVFDRLREEGWIDAVDQG